MPIEHQPRNRIARAALSRQCLRGSMLTLCIGMALVAAACSGGEQDVVSTATSAPTPMATSLEPATTTVATPPAEVLRPHELADRLFAA